VLASGNVPAHVYSLLEPDRSQHFGRPMVKGATDC
jgi:hypothetical protein